MYFIVRRVVDTLLSLIALIILSPVLLIVAIAIKLDSKGEVIFKQLRINSEPWFLMHKIWEREYILLQMIQELQK